MVQSQNTSRRVLGIDPGSQFTGIGIVDFQNKKLSAVHHEVIRLPITENHSIRLKVLFDRLSQIIQLHSPQLLAIENVFLAKNPSSALKLGQVRGVILLSASHHSLPVAEYSSTQVKRLISGFGLAGKSDMAAWVSRLLGPVEVERHDATDALAIAIAHHFLSGGQLNAQISIQSNPGGSGKRRSLAQYLVGSK